MYAVQLKFVIVKAMPPTVFVSLEISVMGIRYPQPGPLGRSEAEPLGELSLQGKEGEVVWVPYPTQCETCSWAYMLGNEVKREAHISVKKC